MAKIELTLTANTQGAVQNLKATQANINKVADAFVKLQNDGTNLSQMNNSVAGFYELVDRLASSLFASGDAASYFDARMKVLESALQSASQMNNGDFSEIADAMRSAYAEAERASLALQEMTDAEVDLEKETKGSTKALDNQKSKLLDVAKNILKFQLVMQPITYAIRAFRQTLSESLETAAEAEQVYSKLSTVFDGLESASDKADALARSIGTATSTAASALSTVGDLLQAQGMTVSESLEVATEWVSKFQDIIAFKDIDMSLEEFAQNFMSGAAGNLRNFRTFGSIVKESAVNARLAKDGLDKLTGTQLELAKMTTRATIALEQQENAYGATEREWESMLSIQRRMEEQSKRLKENLGEYLNTALKPVKSTWTTILDSINKSVEAQRELNKLTAESKQNNSFADWVANAWDKVFGASGSFSNNALKYGTKVLSYDPKSKSYSDWTDDQVKGLVGIGRDTYGFDLAKIQELLGNLGAVSISAERVEKAFNALVGDDANRLAEEARKAEIERLQSNYDTFIESLNSLTNVAVNGSQVFSQGEYNTYGKTALNTALTGMSGSGLKDYANSISVALGDEYTTDALKAKQRDFASLYETAYNFFILNNKDHKLTEENIEFLDEIKGKYQGINDELKKYNDQLKLAEDVTNTIGKGFSNAGSNLAFEKDVDSWMRENEWSEEYAKAYVTALNLYNTTKDQAKLIEDEDKRTKAINDANTEWLKTISDLKAYYEYIEGKAKKIAEETEQTDALNEMVAGWEAADATTADYRKQLAQLGMDDFEKTIADLNESIEKAAAEMDLGLVDSLENQKEAFIKLTEATEKLEEEERKRAEIQAKKDAFFDPLKDSWNLMKGIGGSIWESMKGVWNGAIDATKGTSLLYSLFAGPAGAISGAFGGGAGSMLGGVGGGLSFLAEIATQTEAFQKLTNIVNDYIVPVLDAFLEPLLPIIDYIGKFLQDVLMSFLDWFYPLFNALCAGIALVAGYVEGIFNFIQEGIRWVIGTIVDGIMNVVDAILPGKQSTPEWAKQWAALDPWNNMLKKFDEANATAEKILGMEFKIEKNTEKADYATYAQLLRDKYITSDQYATLVGGNKYSSSTALGSAIMTTGGGTNATYITINGLTLEGIEDGEAFVQYMSDAERGIVAHR